MSSEKDKGQGLRSKVGRCSKCFHAKNTEVKEKQMQPGR